MSDRRRRPRMLPQDVQEWKIRSLQLLGWQSRTQEHMALHAGIKEAGDRILATTMRGQGDNSAEATKGLLKGAGKEFKTYQDLKQKFEAADNRTPGMVDALRQAAQAYIDHFNQHDTKRQRDPTNIAKRDACAATIRELDKFALGFELAGFEAPPWDSATAMKAAGLKTTAALNSLPPGERRAETLGGSNSPTFWINERDDGGRKGKRFLFKPEAFSDIPGIPTGGEPVREMMSTRIADMLNGALGMSIKVPETQVVSLSVGQLPPDVIANLVENGKIQEKGTYTGSVQQFEATEGSSKDMTLKDRAKVPTKSVQEFAVLDIITLNTDRHGGNLLVKRDNLGNPAFVPIDHGRSFPDRKSTDQIGETMAGTHNALLAMPASHEPFTPELLQSIAQLDPDSMIEAMKRERGTLDQVHPGMGAKMSDESLELSKRASMFLKRAAPRLSPAAVQVALGRYSTELMAPGLDANAFNALADRIIDEAEDEQDDLKSFALMPRELQSKMFRELTERGWLAEIGSTAASLRRNPAKALKLWRSGAMGPSKPDFGNGRPIDLDEGTDKELEQVRQAFPGTRVPSDPGGRRRILGDWREWLQLGGTPALLQTAIEQYSPNGYYRDNSAKQLDLAVPILRGYVAMRDALANDNTDPATFALREDVEYLIELLPILDNANRGMTEKVLHPIVQGLVTNRLAGQPLNEAIQGIARLRPTILDKARERLLGKYETFLRQSDNQQQKAQIVEYRDEAREYGLTAGFKKLREFDPQLAAA